MKFLLKLILLLVLFVYSLVYFLPKESIYNLAENELYKHKIIVSNEIREEKAFSFSIKDAHVFFEEIDMAKLKKASFSTNLYETALVFNDIKLLKSLQTMLPSKIATIKAKYTLLQYDRVLIHAKGDFGVLEGEFDIFTRTVTLRLKASRLMKNSYSKLLRKMKKYKGEYIYEYKL